MRSLTMYAADGATVILGPDALGNIVAGAAFAPVKIGFRNEGDEMPTAVGVIPVDVSDGYQMFRIAADTATLSPPYGVLVTVSAPGAGGVWGATGRYRVVVTALNATGETVASVEAVFTIADTTQTISISATAIPTATGYSGYIKVDGGAFTSPSKIADNVSLPIVYDGSAASSGVPPAANTTGGAGPSYGTPPALGLGPIVFDAALAFGQWVFAWAGLVVPSNTLPDGNTRVSGLQFTY